MLECNAYAISNSAAQAARMEGSKMEIINGGNLHRGLRLFCVEDFVEKTLETFMPQSCRCDSSAHFLLYIGSPVNSTLQYVQGICGLGVALISCMYQPSMSLFSSTAIDFIVPYHTIK